MQTHFYLTKLKEHLANKQKLNPQYSLRAFARDLKMHPSVLSQVLKGTRTLPLKDSMSAVNTMKLGPREMSLFMESLILSKGRLDQLKIKPDFERTLLDESHYQIIAEWEHYAVIELYELENFSGSKEEIIKLLGVDEERAEVVLNNLCMAGLLQETEPRIYKKLCVDVRTTEDISSQALKDSHKETLNLGLMKLEEVEVELRDFSSLTLAIDPDKILEAKAIIREFRQKMMVLFKEGKKREVYQLAIQLYPLTSNEMTKEVQ